MCGLALQIIEAMKIQINQPFLFYNALSSSLDNSFTSRIVLHFNRLSSQTLLASDPPKSSFHLFINSLNHSLIHSNNILIKTFVRAKH